ncbi:arsenical resistance protein ArsH [Klebsiella pneumoniae]|nr:arsenical resistance protein ArsH [Klebsiella pneumoniae]
MQVCGGSQSFNAVNQMRILGRWMRMITIPNQSSVAKAWQEFDEDGRMKPSPYYDRIVDVMEEHRTARNLLTDEYRAARTELCQVEVDDASSVCCHKKMD